MYATFDVFFGGRVISLMEYLYAKFGDFIFSRFGFIVRTESHPEANDRYSVSRDYR